MIDIGAESTRPGATPISAEEEWQRLYPCLELLKPLIASGRHIFSIDSRHSSTISLALGFGFTVVNDVSGFTDPLLQQRVISQSNVKVVLMHNLGVPASKSVVISETVDEIAVIEAWGRERITKLLALGLAKDRIIFDPGVGFGKTAQQSLNILKSIAQFKSLGVPLYVGHSRKSFLRSFTDTANPDLETYITSSFLSLQGVDYLRIHDVAGNARAIQAAHYFF